MAGESAAKIFECPSCGSGVQIRAQGLTVSVVCRGCGAIIDASNENYRILSKAAQKRHIEPLIPLGQRGKVHGVLWEVIGFMKRSDESEVYTWREYLLFNPMKGFRWLTEFDGHWNYVVHLKEKPKTGANDAHVLGKTYQLFHRGIAKVLYVEGEFYWRVKVDDKVKVEDYISPPEILSCERHKDETLWALGESIDADTVRTAFAIKSSMPHALGIAPNQLSTLSTASPAIAKYWAFLLIFVFAYQSFFLLSAKNEVVYKGDFSYRFDDTDKQKVTPQFALNNGTKNLDFELRARLDDQWIEINVELVNDQTGETHEFEQGIEYDFGYDGNGIQTSHEVLSSVPAGSYHLNIQAAGPTGPEVPYTVTVIRDVATWGNFIWCLVLLSVYPLFIFWRSRSFERSRWATSDFSPYWSQNEE